MQRLLQVSRPGLVNAAKDFSSAVSLSSRSSTSAAAPLRNSSRPPSAQTALPRAIAGCDATTSDWPRPARVAGEISSRM